MGAHLNMTLAYARAKCGQRIAMPQPFIRGTNISLIGAVSINRVEAAFYGEWAADGEIFNHFVENSLAPQLTPEHIVLLDNVGFHKSERVIDLIKATGAVVDFLPPYSPEFNPIELTWSFIKQIIREQEPRSMSKFQSVLKDALGRITKEKLSGWFAHSGYRLTQ